MGPKERKQRERDDTRGRILDAARELFISEGYDGVSMRRVAEKVEYSATAIYFHFRDKDTLIRELVDNDFLTLAEQFTGASAIADPVERLRATGRAYADFGLTHPNHYRLMFMTPTEQQRKSDDSGLEHGNPEEDAYAFLKSIVVEAIAQGRFREQFNNPELTAQTVWAGVHGVISLEIAKCNDDWIDWEPVRQRIEVMVDLLIEGLLRRKD
jgi:AcrR family transcriptional regulator